MTEKNAIKHYNVKPLHVGLRPSRLLATMLGLATAGSIVLVAWLPMPLWLQLMLVITALCAMPYPVLQDALLRSPTSIVALEVSVNSQLRCMTRSGEWHEVQVLGSSFVTPWLTVLNLRFPGRRFSRNVVLLPDAVAADSYRQLRVWLNWGCQHISDESVFNG